jgi:hypothetical protein
MMNLSLNVLLEKFDRFVNNNSKTVVWTLNVLFLLVLVSHFNDRLKEYQEVFFGVLFVLWTSMFFASLRRGL